MPSETTEKTLRGDYRGVSSSSSDLSSLSPDLFSHHTREDFSGFVFMAVTALRVPFVLHDGDTLVICEGELMLMRALA